MTPVINFYLSSPSQGVWYLGPIPVRAYSLSIICGVSLALIISNKRWKLRGGKLDEVYYIALWIIPFGIFGGRIYHILTDWPTYFGLRGEGIGTAFKLWKGGMGIWGAIIFGGLGLFLEI